MNRHQKYMLYVVYTNNLVHFIFSLSSFQLMTFAMYAAHPKTCTRSSKHGRRGFTRTARPLAPVLTSLVLLPSSPSPSPQGRVYDRADPGICAPPAPRVDRLAWPLLLRCIPNACRQRAADCNILDVLVICERSRRGGQDAVAVVESANDCSANRASGRFQHPKECRLEQEGCHGKRRQRWPNDPAVGCFANVFGRRPVPRLHVSVMRVSSCWSSSCCVVAVAGGKHGTSQTGTQSHVLCVCVYLFVSSSSSSSFYHHHHRLLLLLHDHLHLHDHLLLQGT